MELSYLKGRHIYNNVFHMLAFEKEFTASCFVNFGTNMN